MVNSKNRNRYRYRLSPIAIGIVIAIAIVIVIVIVIAIVLITGCSNAPLCQRRPPREKVWCDVACLPLRPVVVWSGRSGRGEPSFFDRGLKKITGCTTPRQYPPPPPVPHGCTAPCQKSRPYRGRDRRRRRGVLMMTCAVAIDHSPTSHDARNNKCRGRIDIPGFRRPDCVSQG